MHIPLLLVCKVCCVICAKVESDDSERVDWTRRKVSSAGRDLFSQFSSSELCSVCFCFEKRRLFRHHLIRPRVSMHKHIYVFEPPIRSPNTKCPAACDHDRGLASKSVWRVCWNWCRHHCSMPLLWRKCHCCTAHFAGIPGALQSFRYEIVAQTCQTFLNHDFQWPNVSTAAVTPAHRELCFFDSCEWNRTETNKNHKHKKRTEPKGRQSVNEAYTFTILSGLLKF